MPLFETSAKDDLKCDHVEAIFLTLAHKINANKLLFKTTDQESEESSSVQVSASNETESTSGYCCFWTLTEIHFVFCVWICLVYIKSMNLPTTCLLQICLHKNLWIGLHKNYELAYYIISMNFELANLKSINWPTIKSVNLPTINLWIGLYKIYELAYIKIYELAYITEWMSQSFHCYH